MLWGRLTLLWGGHCSRLSHDNLRAVGLLEAGIYAALDAQRHGGSHSVYGIRANSWASAS